MTTSILWEVSHEVIRDIQLLPYRAINPRVSEKRKNVCLLSFVAYLLFKNIRALQRQTVGKHGCYVDVLCDVATVLTASTAVGNRHRTGQERDSSIDAAGGKGRRATFLNS